MRHHSPRMLGVAGAVATLVAPLAVVVAMGSPAEAGGTKKHDLDTYKRETWIAIGDEFPDDSVHTHLYCDDGDFAVDGMWKIDAHDGDDTNVRFEASYGDDVDPTEWHFRATNEGVGRAQVKLFVTCLDYRTGVRDGHTHELVIGPRTLVANGGLVGLAEGDHALPCAANQIPVAPGFNVTAGTGRVYRSYPTANFLSWHWAHRIDAGPATINTYLRCLNMKVSPAGAGPHSHLVDTWWVPAFGGQQEHAPWGIGDLTVDTRRHDEGIIGGFLVDDPFHTYYLGQDARGRVRGYRFFYDGSGADTVHLGALGLDKRTGPQIAP